MTRPSSAHPTQKKSIGDNFEIAHALFKKGLTKMKNSVLLAASFSIAFSASFAMAELPGGDNTKWSYDTQVGETSNWAQDRNNPGPENQLGQEHEPLIL
jgi:hypothetical protein